MNLFVVALNVAGKGEVRKRRRPLYSVSREIASQARSAFTSQGSRIIASDDAAARVIA